MPYFDLGNDVRCAGYHLDFETGKTGDKRGRTGRTLFSGGRKMGLVPTCSARSTTRACEELPHCAADADFNVTALVKSNGAVMERYL